MICALNREQQKIALQVVNRVVAADYSISPQTILKNVYNVVLEEYLKKDMQKHAKEYAFASTQFVARSLHLLVQADSARKMFSELTQTQEQFSKENIEKFEKKEELEKLLGINIGTIQNVPSGISKEQVQSSLDKISSAFPQSIEMVTYSTSSGAPMSWTFPVLKNEDGSNMKLIRVTEFLKGAFAKSKDNSGTISTRRGDLADMVIRKFFSNPVSYDKFKDAILKDKEYTDLFRRFSEQTIPSPDLPSPVVGRYMEEFINDMLYAINFIQTNYKDAYLTDLRSLVESSNMTKDQKSNFYLYSRELGMRGELDLLAVYPNGTFKVIDIKTSDGLVNTNEKVKYGRQASIYDLMISSATGLKSIGENDIIYLTAGISNVSTILGIKDKGNLRLSISGYTKVTNKNQNPDLLSKEIQIYRDKINSLYDRVVPIVKNNQAINPLNPMLTAWYRSKGKNSDNSLKMIFKSNDNLATREDLLKGQAWLEERFPELKGKIHIHRTMNSKKGAEFFLDSIEFYEKVNKGADYHEGWHRFSQLYLTKDEKKILYKSIQQQAIDFTTRDGRTLNTQFADYLEIEEFLAEEFRRYAQSPSTYSPMKGNKKVKSLFRQILDALKSIWNWFTNQGTLSYLEMFKQLNSNTFNKSNFSVDNAIFTHLNSLFVDSSGNNGVIDNMTFREFRDFSDFNITQYLTENSITISDLLTAEGSRKLNEIIKDSLEAQREAIATMRQEINDSIQNSDDEVVNANLKTNEENLATYSNLLDFVLEKNPDGKYVRMGDFIRAYYKFSQYKSLRNLFDKNQKRINQIIDEESLTEFMKKEEEGDNDVEGDEEKRPTDEQAPDLDYNNPGNLKQAIEFARDELKDFFNGIPRLLSSDLNEEQYEMTEGGFPATLSREEAFYKTLNILQGSPTLSLMIQQLNSSKSYMLFPELRTVADRLLGNQDKDIQGLIPKYIELSSILSSGQATDEDIEQHGKLMSFLMHFAHVMSLRKVPFDTVIRRTNFTPDNKNPYLQSPSHTRENLESIINSILNDFSKGFQTHTKERFKESKSKYTSLYEVMYQIFGKGEQGLNKFMMDFGNENQFIYDHIGNRFYFNALYVNKNFTTNNPNKEQLKEFFINLGIVINDKAYENPNHLEELKSIYNRIRDLLFTYHKRTGEQVAKMYKTNVPALVKAWKDTQTYANNPELTGTQKIIAMNALRSKEEELQGYARRLFSSSPVSRMLFDGKDKNLLKNPSYKVFAAYLPLFQQLARIEKNYHKRFSSGSMIVLDKLQFSHFLPNNMLIADMLINEHINSYSDFAKHPELSHLDPIKNPQILNSWLFRKIFSPAGTKVPNMRLGVSVISQVYDISDETISGKRIQDMSAEEKMLADFIMLKTEGSSEMRRMETSNTAWRLSLNRIDGIERTFIKPVDIENTGFSNPAFLSQIRDYIQYAAWKYQYYQIEANAKRDSKHANNGLEKLGVFDEMIPLTKERLKSFIRKAEGDMNTLMVRLEKEDEELFKDMNKEIVNYFEGITITNTNSYKAAFNKALSQKSQRILFDLSNINSVHNPFYLKMTTTGQFNDGMYRDVIANDFIMAMEDSLLFFGDYTYYKDPIKRRKIIANNGSVNIVDDIIAQGMDAQIKARSLKSTYQSEVTDKDYKLVKKVVIADVKMKSSKLEDDKMLKELHLLYQQKFNGAKAHLTLEDIRREKANAITAFSEMEVADAGAYLNLDTNRFMRMREMVWDWDKDEKEYKRQILLLKKSMKNELTEDEVEFISAGPNKDGSYSQFNVSKYALTGPIYRNESGPFTPSFDKMGLRVLLPEFDWNRITRPLFEKMYGEDIDYMVMDSGSKAFTPPIENVFSADGRESTVNAAKVLHSTYHAGGYFKFQQNTTHVNDSSTFAVQLRSIFYEGLLAQQKYGSVSTQLLNSYKKVVRSLANYIRINSSRGLTEMGLDINGKMRDKATFAKYLRERMLQIGDVDEKILDLLSTDNSGEFSNFLESLPFQKNVVDLIAGIIDDNFRKVKLNGTKFYQSFEMGSSVLKKTTDEDLPLEYRGTIELKWHGLKVVDNKVISTTPVECRIPFRKQFYSLLNLKHEDGQRIGTLKRLNESLRNESWVNTYADSITFLGVRIPLQDLNFTSHMIVKEFLPEAFGDMIILPPEFYQQTGSDNDIDTVTASFRYLNNLGRVITRPSEKYEDIITKIEELSTKISNDNKFVVVKTDNDIKEELEEIKKAFLENEIYALKGKTVQDLERDLTIVEQDGYRTVSGFINSKSTLFKLRTKNREEFVEVMDSVEAFVNSLNKKKKIDSPELKKLNEMNNKKENYIKGVSNDIVGSIAEFLEAPENYDFLTETDSIQKIKELAEENVLRKTGQKIDLNESLSSLEAMGYLANIANHHNNFAIRTILGSLVRFRSVLPLLEMAELIIQKEYRAGSLNDLLKRVDSGIAIVEEAKSKEKTYKRNILTPLLYKKDTKNGIKISVFDENGNRATKNLSSQVSSLLDLFKHAKIFPSLDITWLNVKPMIFLMAQGVPMERAILFLNNPIVQDVQRELNELGTDAFPKHALVSAIQKWNDDIFPAPANEIDSKGNNPSKTGFPGWGRYRVKNELPNGKQEINNFMFATGPAATEYLGNKYISFSEKELADFTIEYGEFLRNTPKEYRTMAHFLKTNPSYENIAKDIAAYYGTLLADGDMFYTSFVKGTARNSTKVNSKSAITYMNALKQARIISSMANPEFEEKLENESMISPFYNDETINNMLSNAFPNILTNDNKHFVKEYNDMLQRIIWKTRGTPEDRRKVEMRVMSDFLYSTYLNFFIFKDGMNANKLYEYFEFDITPILRPLVEGSENYKTFFKEFFTKSDTISEDEKIGALFNKSLLSGQLETLTSKYPELADIPLIQSIDVKAEHGVDPLKDGIPDFKDILNTLPQNYITFNLSPNPKDREAEETVIRDNFEKLYMFDISLFPTLEARLKQNPDRLDVFKNEDNINEIRRTFNILAYYLMTQSSHLERNKGSFSYLVPPVLLKKVVETSIKNFNRFLKEGASFRGGETSEAKNNEVINKYLMEFEAMFKDMNPDLKWSNPIVINTQVQPEIDETNEQFGVHATDISRTQPKDRPGIPYQKSHTGKLYSKLRNVDIDHFMNRLANEQGVKLDGRNNFNIEDKNNEIDPLNCER